MTSSENAFWTSAKTPYLDYVKKKGTKVDVDDDPRSMILEPKNRVGLLVGKGKERLRNIAEKYSEEYKVRSNFGEHSLLMLGPTQASFLPIESDSQFHSTYL